MGAQTLNRYKPVGWRGESHRHYLAAKGVKTKRYYAYNPTYVSGDLPVIAGDAVGTAGASAVSVIPVVVPIGLAYLLAKKAKQHKDKTGHWYLVEKESKDDFYKRIGATPYNPLDPKTAHAKPAGFRDLSLEDKERYVKEQEAELRDAEIFVKNVEEMSVHHPEFVREHYGPLSETFEAEERAKQEAARIAFTKAVPPVPPETRAPTEEQVLAEKPESEDIRAARRELIRLQEEQKLYEDLR